MTKIREILRHSILGLSKNAIAKSCSVSKSKVNLVLKRAKEMNLNISEALQMSDAELTQLLFPNGAYSASSEPEKCMPDFAYIRKELLKNGVTKKLLWTEYLAKCKLSNQKAFMYSQFCWQIQQDEQKHRATMHIKRKPGEQFEVDWAGDTAHLIDLSTGEIIKAYVFVGISTYSLYTYAEAFLDMKEQSWITAHNHMYQFFGGVSKILVPDNCKTAVLHTDNWHMQQLNPAYKELGEHYNTIIIPARVRTPKDKATVEGTVGNISSQILAALRNEEFFTLAELNTAIRAKLEIFNKQPFQKKEGSRFEIFRDEELPLLASLPATLYELAEWKQATVQYNYHISCEGMMYSVPYEYIHRKVSVRLTDKVVKIFYNDIVIATHYRLKGRKGQYSTVTEHMPKEHQAYAKWDGEYFRNWAKRLGPNIYNVIDAILRSSKIEQQYYRSCIGLLQMTKKYSVKRLDSACAKALSYTSSPSYKIVKDILLTQKDEPQEDIQETAKKPRGITRGASYYKGGQSK